MYNNRPTKTQIIAAIRQAKASEERLVDANRGETNPQIVELTQRAIGAIEAYDSVLYALQRHSLSMLRE